MCFADQRLQALSLDGLEHQEHVEGPSLDEYRRASLRSSTRAVRRFTALVPEAEPWSRPTAGSGRVPRRTETTASCRKINRS